MLKRINNGGKDTFTAMERKGVPNNKYALAREMEEVRRKKFNETAIATAEVIDIYGGKQIRPLIHIEDITNLYIHILLKNVNEGIYNASKENISIIDLVYLIVTILSLIKCYKKGFILSILSMAKWLLAYVITLLLFPRTKPS